MTTKTMKFIDETFGPVACFFFHWYNFFKKLFFRSRFLPAPENVNNILVIKFFGMGSIMLATPMIRALKKKFPRARVILLTFAENEALARRLKLIDEVVVVQTKTFFSFLKSLLWAIFNIRARACDVSLDLEFFAKTSSLIQYLCGARVRVGYYLIQIGFLLKMMWRGNLLTRNVYYNPHRHVTEAFMALARSVGAGTEDQSLERPDIYPEDNACLGELLASEGIRQDEPLIVMNINSGRLCLERRWPVENFAHLARDIRNGGGSRIALVGDKQEALYAEKFINFLGEKNGVINLTGKLTLGMLVVLLKRSSLFITNDSGPLHLAVSLGVSTVSFFGPETPERFGPLGENHTVFYSGVYCSPCLNVYNQKTAPCNGQNVCMANIPPEEVYETMKKRYFSGL